MKIADISTLLRTLEEDNWYATEPDEWSTLLEDLHEGHAQGDLDALIVFLDFAADSFGAQHDWATKEFREFFEQAYRACAPTAEKAIREYFREHEETSDLHMLAEDAGGNQWADYFDWEGYVQDHRPDLHVAERGRAAYVFLGE